MKKEVVIGCYYDILEKAIGRLINLAQEKNSNWLGLTNIKAMQLVLDYVNKLENKISILKQREKKLEEKNAASLIHKSKIKAKKEELHANHIKREYHKLVYSSWEVEKILDELIEDK